MDLSDREESPTGSLANSFKEKSPAASEHFSERKASIRASRSRSASEARSPYHKRSRSRSGRRYSRSRSPSRERKRYYSRSRSRSPYEDRRSSYRSGRRYSGGGGGPRARSPYNRQGGSGYNDRRRGGFNSRRHSRSPLSRRRRHKDDRENPKTSLCLGVFGLSLYTQERDLREAFARYGPIEEIQIVYDHQTGRSRGFAFIYMRNLEDAEEAKERAAGTEIDGRKIRVDYSITERAHTPTPGIYLGTPSSGYRSSRRSASPCTRGGRGGRRGYSRSRSRSRSYSPRRY